ncbi:peptidoglycan-associated lipoprotein Pal [Kordiimonas aestuarii]|uniref:peptidoglycan-associated lipoprotein Pal n=1 Tax=Kordiimonas aestuarii TaxID=1005925 RepID=UPI0021D38CA2|nr:peptidoglycan-associated lipoprotein Pal [Kordiimonas aestuarii]
MTSKRLGKNIAVISAVALMLAACSNNDKAVEEKAPPATEMEDSGASGRPDKPSTPVMTQEELEAQKMGSPNQSGLTNYAGDRIFFAYDSSELSAEARGTLAKQAEWLKHFPRVDVTVEGHCDERGTREYNLALGERRATAVKNYLIARGVPASRLKTISYGKERPAVVGNGESTWSQNRRGVLVVQ